MIHKGVVDDRLIMCVYLQIVMWYQVLIVVVLIVLFAGVICGSEKRVVLTEARPQSKPVAVSCGCAGLQTWHPGRVEHKSKCRKFRSLNPQLTFTEFMKTEGFRIPDGTQWPRGDASAEIDQL